MPVPDKCWFVTPWPTPINFEQREENWYYMMRWANTILLNPDAHCFCWDCDFQYSTGPEECWLHIPYPNTDDPEEEQINWYALMRWVSQTLPVCDCYGGK